MERRMLLAIVLSFAVVMLYGAATGKCTPPPQEEPTPGEEGPEQPGEPGAPQPGQPAVPGQPGDPAAPADPAAPSDPAQPRPGPGVPGPAEDEADEPVAPLDTAPPRRATASSAEFEIGFTDMGGAIEWVRLQHAFEPDNTTRLDIVVPTAPDLLLGAVDARHLLPGYTPPGDATRRDDPAGILRTVRWTRDVDAEARSPENDVIYQYRVEGKGTWVKQWVLPDPDALSRYDVHLRLAYRPENGTDADPIPLRVLVTAGLLREPSTGAIFQAYDAGIGLQRMSRESEAEEFPHGVPMPGPDVDPDDVRLLGARTNYFLSTWFMGSDEATTPRIIRWWGTGESELRRKDIREYVANFFLEQRGRDWKQEQMLRDRIHAGVDSLHQSWMVVDVPASENQYVDLPLYVGPIDRTTLRQDMYAGVATVIEYKAAPDILADALLGIYDLFRRLFGSAGLGVILMTLVVRGVMMPLSIKNQLSMRRYSRKIARIKPKLDVIKAKFANNPKKLREEQAKLYREHGVGFPSGCLMLLIQLPIFFALFSSLRTEYSLRGESFLWIKDLSGPDRLIDFGKTVLDLGILQISSINLLPLLMVALSIWQQRLMPKPADEQQAQQMRMMKWMPIIFAVILYNYTAALALYMVFSSSVAILESRIVRWRDKDADAPPAAPTKGKGAAAAATS